MTTVGGAADDRNSGAEVASTAIIAFLDDDARAHPGWLAALVAPNFFREGAKARVKTAKLQIANISTALDAMALDTGRYPTAQEGLRALIEAPSGMERWDGPYLKKLPKDPWSNDYVYRGPQGSSSYEILCYGADGSPGGDGDNADLSNLD
mgnify:CR=1 FL=1